MATSIMLLCVIFRGIIQTAAEDSSFTVSQAPKEAKVFIGQNVTLYCIFPLSPDQTWVRVLWWKHGENEYLRTSRDKRKKFGMEGKASGFFQLLEATIQDAGIYHCTVIRQGEVRGNGTGSHLRVYAAPTPLTIVAGLYKGNSSTSLTLKCETAAFYPENFTLTWYKNGIETAVGISTSEVKNAEGLYEVSSSLVETQPVLIDMNYSCSVSHVSLQTPAFATHTVSKSNPDNDQKPRYFWIPIFAVAGSVFLVFLIVFGAWSLLKNNRDDSVAGANHDKEMHQQSVTGEDVTYAIVSTTSWGRTGQCI